MVQQKRLHPPSFIFFWFLTKNKNNLRFACPIKYIVFTKFQISTDAYLTHNTMSFLMPISISLVDWWERKRNRFFIVYKSETSGDACEEVTYCWCCLVHHSDCGWQQQTPIKFMSTSLKRRQKRKNGNLVKSWESFWVSSTQPSPSQSFFCHTK